MNASNSRRLALPKPRPKPGKAMHARTRIRPVSARQRKDKAYAAKVRKVVAERDGGCRVGKLMARTSLPPCDGDLAWCHMEGKRRSQTRRMAPQDRHSTAWTVMLCAFHAELEERHLIRTEYLSTRGADGPMLFTLKSGDTLAEAA